MAFAIKPGQTILFTGDSITDAGRRGEQAPMGNGYAKFAANLITARYPNHRIQFLNTGISGNTVRDLMNRWTDDVIRHQPDWLSIMIGINDIHRWYHKIAGATVTPEEYAEIYPKILERVRKETKAQIILIDPFYISTDTSNGSARADILRDLPKYIRTVHAMAKRFKTRHVRMHDAFQKLLKTHSPDAFCPEPVHPNISGHLVMAHEWLKAVDW